MADENKSARPRAALASVLLWDLLLTCLLLSVFFTLKLLLPALLAGRAVTTVPDPAPVETAAEPTPEAALPVEAASVPGPEPTPDTRTPWQIRFAEHFSPVPVLTDHSYTSPETSIDIQTHTRQFRKRTAVYHVADIYLASPEQFCTYTANNELKYFSVQAVEEMDRAAGAILSISGDCYSYQHYALLLRNGVAYKTDHAYEEICVLWPDGRLETLAYGDYKVDELLAEGPAQIWCFGPALLDAEGHVKRYYSASTAVSYTNPRCAIGYYEPGHYCFVVVDGRQHGYSDGVLLDELALIFEELGCRAAYNLDGGGTAVMFFNHRPFSRQSNGADREIGDILLIKEDAWS